MNEQPILATQHLYLRPLRLDDASSLQNLAGAKEIKEGLMRQRVRKWEKF